MEIGQLVDFVEEYNRIHAANSTDGFREKAPETRRDATQADWEAFWD